MATSQTLITVALLVLLIFIVWQFISGLKARTSVAETVAGASILHDRQAVPVSNQSQWWTSLSAADQSALATDAASWCMPLWSSYLSAHKTSVKNLPPGHVVTIDNNLLSSALEAVRSYKSAGPSKETDTQLRKSYTQLLEPMVALQDGNWSIPYPLKKLFIGIYTMVEGALVPEAGADHQARIIESIGHSMDCLELSRLYSDAELDKLLQPYKPGTVSEHSVQPLNAVPAP